ncbi:MAG: hypothetical protein JWL59_2684 [Chthoniobacteraceae bacterium]|nr:hypothetical protein [Chthoniobacteraceae bacterium]
MKRITGLLIGLVWMDIHFVSAQDQLSPETHRFITELTNEQRSREASSLSTGEKLRRIRELRACSLENPSGKNICRLMMAWLGDEESLLQLIQEFIQNDATGPGVLGIMQNPHIIDLVAPAFFGEEKWESGEGDVFYIPRSYRAAELAVAVLDNSPAFNDNVTNWARTLRRLTSSELRAIIRPWWKQNEKFFHSMNYKAVQPGLSPAQDLASTKYSDAAPVATTAATPISTPASSVVSADESPAPSTKMLWIAVAVAMALLATVLVFSTRRT